MTHLTEDEENALKLAPAMEARAQGDHSPALTCDAAQTCAEAVRTLNRATGDYSGDGIVWPSTLHDVLTSLDAAALGLDQFARQSSAWLREQHAAGRIRVFVGGEYAADAEVRGATAGLTRVREAAAALADAQASAANMVVE